MNPNKNYQSQSHLPIPAETERIGKQVLGAAFKVHTALGPGLLESAYEACLIYELHKMGIKAQAQVVLPVIYAEQKIELGYRIDLLVENCVIVELKAVEQMLPLFEAQLLTYMKLSGVRLGYLLNFNTAKLKHGIKRMVM